MAALAAEMDVDFLKGDGLNVKPLLRIQDLSVRYGQLLALDGATLEVQPGELVALAGENGAGKTTLIRCIAGDIAYETGKILFNGQPVGRDPAATARQGMAIVWQDLALCDNLKVAEHLLLGWESSRFYLSEIDTSIRAASILRELGIHLGDLDRPVKHLSGGQRQLLAVARSMRGNPQLLMLDEPTASLGINEGARVEELITALHQKGTTILFASHDIDQMFRLADRIIILHHGQVAADIDPGTTYADDVIALISGQQPDTSARHQLIRFHGLIDRLASVPPSSSLPLILSALSAALVVGKLSIHLLEEKGTALRCVASQGLPPAALSAWARLSPDAAGGPIGVAAGAGRVVIEEDAQIGMAWSRFRDLITTSGIRSSWSVPIMGSSGLIGVITIFSGIQGPPERDQLDLITLYAGYAANTIERDRLLEDAASRNHVLETVREMLESLAGPTLATEGFVLALQALRSGLQASMTGLWAVPHDDVPHCRFLVEDSGIALNAPQYPLPRPISQAKLTWMAGKAVPLQDTDGGRYIAVTFPAPKGRATLVARWDNENIPDSATALIEDTAHSLRLALEREQAETANQEAAALRRSQDLQLSFLSKLSHELRTPLTAIRGYASSLLQPDVTWDADSQRHFLTTIATESARLGRLVNNLLDFSSIESDTLRLIPDWCEIDLVLEAAATCLPLNSAHVAIQCDDGLPAIWADHDRLQQVFVNLLHNAVYHNPPGTHVSVTASLDGSCGVVIHVSDDGTEVPEGTSLLEPVRWKQSGTSGTRLGLSIAQGIVEAHGGKITFQRLERGKAFSVHLPVEPPTKALSLEAAMQSSGKAGQTS
ncbi:MAG: ATP-binding cassette domain-containing protein [Actinobacteria bacterium]|nr:ATP-binding cassette domain-containing protein [Actinomycetota bacterium]MCL5446545.1 ATP-binding cassette domain-containing protein [Actinomycetota bacterium]